MLGKLKSIIMSLEASQTTITGWLAAFTAIVFVRLFLEQFSNPSLSGIFESNPYTALHVFLFFLAVTLGITLIVSSLTKQRGNAVISLALLGLPIIWLAPTFDLLFAKGGASPMAYMFESHTEILKNFFTFFGPISTPGITAGIHVEVFFILLCIGAYLWVKTRHTTKTAIGVTLSYAVIFLALALPGIIFTLSHETGEDNLLVSSFIKDSLINSEILSNTSFSHAPTGRQVEIGFDALVSRIFFLVSFVFLFLWSWYSHKKITSVVIRNSRPERILFYTSLLVLGAGFSFVLFPLSLSWVTAIGFLVLLVSLASAWMYAVHTNDTYDIEIDMISNSDRPLIKNEVAKKTFHEVGNLWLASSLIGSYLAGSIPFFMMLIFTSSYYMYSVPPLRLKRIPLVSSLLIALACLTSVLAGFFFLSPLKTLSVFPSSLALGIIVMFALAVNIRDLKDIAGDKAAGIQTLPVLFGKHGKRVVGGLLALSFLLLPIFLNFYTLYILSIPTAIIGYRLCVREPYNERNIFALYFAFCALTLLLIFFLLSLVK